MKITPIDKDERKVGYNRVLTVSSQYTGDLEYLIKHMIGHIPTEVYCFVNELGTKYYYVKQEDE